MRATNVELSWRDHLAESWSLYRDWLLFKEATPGKVSAAVRRHGLRGFHELHAALRPFPDAGVSRRDVYEWLLGGGPMPDWFGWRRRKLIRHDLYQWLRGLGPIADWLDHFSVEPFLELAQRATADEIPNREIAEILSDRLVSVRGKIADAESLRAYGTAWIEIYRAGVDWRCALALLGQTLPWITSAEQMREVVLRTLGRDDGRRTPHFCSLFPLFSVQLTREQDLADYWAVFDEVASTEVNELKGFHEAAALHLEHVRTPQELRDLLVMGREVSKHIKYWESSSSMSLMRGLIREYGLQPMLDMLIAAGPTADELYWKGLPAMLPLIEEYGIAPFVAMASYEGASAALLFTQGLMPARSLIERLGIDAFVNLSADAGPHTASICQALVESPEPIASEANLRDQSVWRRALYSTRRSLQRPWLEHLEDTDPYGMSYGTYTINKDPDRVRREAIDRALGMLRHTLRTRAEGKPAFVDATLDIVTNLPPGVEEFLDILVDNGFDDVVVVGGVPRDILLGREPGDVDFTFAMDLLPEDIALMNDPYLWNSLLAGGLGDRPSAVFRLMDSAGRGLGGDSVPDHPIHVDRVFGGLTLHYVGPFESYRDQYTRARWSAVFFKDLGRLLTLDPGVTINSLGITTDRRLIGDPAGLEDLQRRIIRTLRPVSSVSLAPDTALRYVSLATRLGCSLSTDIEEAIRDFGNRARANRKEFVRQSTKTTGVTQLLAEAGDPANPAMLDAMVHFGIADIYARLPNPEAKQLKRLLKTR